MKRSLRFILMLVVALFIVPFLPLYIERTMVRSWQVDHKGDIIEWGWRLISLRSYWSDYNYIKREQDPAFWLSVNLALALIYALAIAFIIDRIIARRGRDASGSR